jgi:hypothetical protein
VHERTAKVQSWADQVDFEILDRQMHNRRTRGMKPSGKDSDQEQLARYALQEEDEGKLADAAKRWKELSKQIGNADPEIRSWGLVGDRYWKRLQDVKERYLQLRGKIEKENESKKSDEKASFANDEEKDAEGAKDNLTEASRRWDGLKKATHGKDDLRHWYLLASMRVQELSAEKERANK